MKHLLRSLIWMAFLLPLAAQANDPLALGQSQYSRLDFAGARQTFQRILDTPSLGSQHPDALLWLARTEMALKAYANASRLLEEFLQKHPAHRLAGEALYEKGRLLHYTEDHENALLALDAFLKLEPPPELTANALFWMGESALALGRWEQAQVLYRTVVERYPMSYKVEASRYRLAMIDMRLREEELLRLLRWSHEELINSLEEFRRRERAYQQAVQAYQRRILELERSDLAERVKQLEQELREARAARGSFPIQRPATMPTDTSAQSNEAAPATPAPDVSVLRALQELKAQAEELKRFYDDWEAMNDPRR